MGCASSNPEVIEQGEKGHVSHSSISSSQVQPSSGVDLRADPNMDLDPNVPLGTPTRPPIESDSDDDLFSEATKSEPSFQRRFDTDFTTKGGFKRSMSKPRHIGKVAADGSPLKPKPTEIPTLELPQWSSEVLNERLFTALFGDDFKFFEFILSAKLPGISVDDLSDQFSDYAWAELNLAELSLVTFGAAVSAWRSLEVLIDAGLDPNSIVEEMHSVWYAASRGSLRTVQLLVEKGAIVQPPSDWSILASVPVSTLTFLISKGLSFGASGPFNETPAHFASLYDSDLLDVLLANGLKESITMVDSDGRPPLLRHEALSNCCVVEKLIKVGGAQVNQCCSDDGSFPGTSALYWASYNGFLDSAMVLLANGADTSITDKSGVSPVGAAFARKHYSLVHELVEKHSGLVGILPPSTDPSVFAIAMDDVNTIMCQIDLRTVEWYVISALAGASETLQYLLDTEQPSDEIVVEMMRAAVKQGHDAILSILLDSGLVDPSAIIQEFLREPMICPRIVSNILVSVLDTGITSGLDDVLRFVARHGMTSAVATVLQFVSPDASVLFEAVSSQNLETVTAIIAAGADCTESVVQKAISSGSLAVLEFLLDQGLFDPCEAHLRTAAGLFSQKVSEEAVQLLLDAGAEAIFQPTKHACVGVLFESVSVEALSLHLRQPNDNRFEVDEVAARAIAEGLVVPDQSCIINAVRNGHQLTVDIIVELHGDLSVCDPDGVPLIHIADSCRYHKYGIISSLLKGGAQILAENPKTGETGLDLVHVREFGGIQTLL